MGASSHAGGLEFAGLRAALRVAGMWLPASLSRARLECHFWRIEQTILRLGAWG
jgi:hypothetical protein